MSWLLAFSGFAALIVLHEFGHFIAAKAVGMRVERFALFFPPLIFKFKRGETEYGIGAIPLGGFVKITGMNPEEEIPPEIAHRAYHRQAVWKRIVVIAAGPLMNIAIAFVLAVVFFAMIGTKDVSTTIDSVDKNAAAAGQLFAGDRVVAIDGKRGGPEVLAKAVSAQKCPGKLKPGCQGDPVNVTIARAGETVAFTVRPRYDGTTKSMRLGFRFAFERETIPFGQAITTSTSRLWELTKATVSLPARIFNEEKRKEISGVVGTYETTRQTIIQEPADVVAILAIISLSLAVINLFPFLPLDGGHIFWALVEAVRRRPVSLAVMERASVVGFMLVIALFIIGFSNDLSRLNGEGFGR